MFITKYDTFRTFCSKNLILFGYFGSKSDTFPMFWTQLRYLEKWDSKRYLGRGFFPKKIEIGEIFFAMRRMTMNVGAFESPDLGGPSRYPQRIP